MKFINKITLFAACAAMLTACSNKDDYSVGQWDAASNYANVSFVETDLSEELEPSETCIKTFEITRTNTVGALDVKFTVKENTDNVFSVAPAHFADGEETATFDVTFDKAEIGKDYNLQLQIEGAGLTSSYAQNTVFNYSVCRVKWNFIGQGKFFDDCRWGYDIPGEADVEIYQKDGDNWTYRIMYPFDNMKIVAEGKTYTAEDAMTGSQAKSITVTILQPGTEVEGVEYEDGEDVVYFAPANSGDYASNYSSELIYMHPVTAGNTMSGWSDCLDPSTWASNKVLVWLDEEHKTPGKIQLAPAVYVPSVSGAFDYTTKDESLVITFPGYVDKHDADIAKDFDWEEVFEGDFTSEALNTKGTAVLYKGTCAYGETEKETADVAARFAEKYGEAYCIASPYAEDYHIYFAVKDGEIMIPDGYEKQETGLNALSNMIYASINGTSSKFSEKDIQLDMTFTNEDGTVEYGTGIERLKQVKFTTIGSATFTYTQFFTDEDEEGNDVPAEAELELQQNESNPSEYRLLDWGYDEGDHFMFTWNEKTNQCTVPAQPIGYVSQTYGMIYVSDVAQYQENPAAYEKYPCYYDEEEKCFIFTLIYYDMVDPSEPWAMGSEYMTINESGVKAQAKVKTLRVPFNQSAKASKKAAPKKHKKVISKKCGKTMKTTAVKPLVGKKSNKRDAKKMLRF
ncbi:MAG: hypothetical protein KBT12_00215 [Bacteroidales bacterium]|nr:hypothetical protein [Candidatus Physcousia equi]